MKKNIEDKNETVMKLVHYFITERGYNPVIMHGLTDEVWLENMSADVKIVKISSSYIHNDEQFDFDILKTKNLIKKLKKATYSLNLNAVILYVNLSEYVTSNKIDLMKIQDIETFKINTIEDLASRKLKNFFPDLSKKTIHEEEGVELFSKISNEISVTQTKENEKMGKLFKKEKPVLTIILIALNILVFMAAIILSSGNLNKMLETFGGLVPELFKKGEYLKLLTSIFVSSSLIQLSVICYSIFVLGSELETLFGKTKTLIIYIVSGITSGLLMSLFIATPEALASAPIFGFIAALIVFGTKYKVYFASIFKKLIVPIFILNILTNELFLGTSNFTLVGGVIGGYLITKIIGIPHKEDKEEKIKSTVMLVVFTLFLLGLNIFYI